VPGLLDILGALLGGGQQPQGLLNQQPGMMAQNQPQGMLNQQPINPQQGGLPPNFLQTVSKALIAQGQPSMYKQGTGMGLMGALNAGLSGDASGIERQAMMNHPQGMKMMGAGSPSSVQEYEYYNRLSPEQKKVWNEGRRGTKWVDAGDKYVDSVTGETIMKNLAPGERPETKGAQTKAQEDAKNLAEAQKNLPGASDTANTALRYIEEIRNHPGKSDVVGMPNILTNPAGMWGGKPLRGTDAAGFQARLDQLKGGQFLQAYETLKGGGQITEVEGKKAQDAIARMDTAQNEQEFDKALSDYEAIIKLGLDRARNKAGVSVSTERPPTNNNVISAADYFK
jgi:hypothetical protein